MNSNSEIRDAGSSCEFQENLKILRQIPVFSPLPMDTLKIFAYLCSREHYKPGDVLFHQNEDDGQAFFVISGSARLIHDGDAGSVEFAELSEGHFVGGLSLLGKMPRLFTLKAVTETTCLTMNREKFIRAIGQFPDIMPKILHALVDRIYRWEKRLLAAHAETCEDCMSRIGVSLI